MTSGGHATAPRTVLVAHHTPDLYGSDRQLLESVSGMLAAGTSVVVTLPHDGPLVALLRERGARVTLLPTPVVRRSALSPRGLPALLWRALRTLPAAVRLTRSCGAEVVYVNTLILPFWLVVARLARVPALCHVHEAPESGPKALRAVLVLPLLLARGVVTNSEFAAANLGRVSRRVARRAVVVPNGVPTPPQAPAPAPRLAHPAGPRAPARLVLVGRLSPNKGVDLALEALAELVHRGYDVRLSVLGSVFPGYEWYETELRSRAAQPDLAGRVELLGYVNPTWPVLAACDIALVPSRIESFGNAAAEAMLSMRPVVATSVQGLPEVVQDGVTGLLVPAEDAAALAAAVASLLDDPELAGRLGRQGREAAESRFSVTSYQNELNVQIAHTGRIPLKPAKTRH